MSFSSLLCNQVSILRRTDVLFLNRSFPLNFSATTTPDKNPFVVELNSTGITTANIMVEGTLNNLAVTESIQLIGGAIDAKITTKEFDTITAIYCGVTLGGSVTGRLKTNFGEAVFIDKQLYNILQCRLVNFKNHKQGSVNLQPIGHINEDRIILFTNVPIGYILVEDYVTDLDTNLRYKVFDINYVYDSVRYHHSEMVLEKLV